MASVDYFLKIDGIDGESKDVKHPNEIQLDSFSWGESNSGQGSATGGGGAGKVSMQDFHFTAKTTKASPKLMLACASGEHIRSAQLTARKHGETPFEFLFVKIEEVVVTSFQFGGSVQSAGAHEVLPEDQVSMAFAKIRVDFKDQKADGVLETTTFAWDLAANKKV